MPTLNMSNIAHHKGITGAESLMIAEQRLYESNILFLQEFDLEELNMQEVQQIKDIATREYTCEGCEKKEDSVGYVRFEFDMFIDELQHRLDDLRDIFPRNDKGMVKEFNRFAEKMNKEWKDRNDKIIEKTGIQAEYTLDIMPMDYEENE